MTLWSWTALDEQGNRLKGLSEESNKSLVVVRLREQNLFPVRIHRALFRTCLLRVMATRSKLYWSKASRKIGLMLEAGVPLLTVLEIMVDKENRVYRKRSWQKVYQSVRDGNELGLSMQAFHPPLGLHLEALIIAGERSGTLTNSFLEIAAQMEEEYFFEQKIKTALFYPILLFVIAVLVTYTLSVLVLPMYETLFSSLEAELPLITILIFNVGNYIPHGFAISVALAIGVVLFRGRNRKTKSANNFFYRIPGINQITRHQDVILFCSLLQRLLNAGMPLLQALDVMEGAVRRSDMKKLICDLVFEVREGKRLAPVFFVNSFFPSEAAKMIAVAEESGRLSEMLSHIARILRKELEDKLQKYTKMLEPLLVIGIAGIVGVVAVGILLPLFEMSMYIR